jgi:demethylmenaquinone methyltransferase/2-methoxy-6-polyprenyl-1,4-benzoquinol methylase
MGFDSGAGAVLMSPSKKSPPQSEATERQRVPRIRDRLYIPGLLYSEILDRPLSGIRRKVRELVRAGSLFPLLDICCGPGTQCGRLKRDGGPIFGLDINLRMTKYAAARHPGVLFICADAVALPFQPGIFRGIIISFALHEKPPWIRPRVLAAAKEILAPGGRIILVDFEQPWSAGSRAALCYVSVIERLAGREHFRNGRDFLGRGGLETILRDHGFTEVGRSNIEAGSCAIVLARVSGPEI